ncbi:uncharacterized protein LOC141701791 [Apium graveolens]|uniref:uncharacterized protein LOC141701791 n=1 Tax=Apium graveolens TaxID=4045 RepID=UPI003D7B1528
MYGGHYGGEKTAACILQAGFFWNTLFKDAHQFVSKCDRCQRVGNMSKRDEMPLNIFTRFGTPRVIIIDEGWHFCNCKFTALMERYQVNHHVATAYHPQTNGQAEVSNREIKRILEKELVYKKACHLHAKLEHRAFWALKNMNLEMAAAGKKRMLQLNEIDKFRLQAYENNKLNKEKVKRWDDRRLVRKSFVSGQQVLLFNAHLRLFPGKLKSRWSGPFIIKAVFLHGAVEIFDKHPNQAFKVNGQRLNYYYGDMVNLEVVSVVLSTT